MSDSRFKLTVTGAGIAAIIAAIPGILAHFKEETVAKQVAVSAEKTNETLFANQLKLKDRMLVAETRLETLLAILQRNAAPDYAPTLPLPTSRPAPSEKKCRRNHVLQDGKCVLAVEVVAEQKEELAQAKVRARRVLQAVTKEKKLMLKTQQKLKAPTSLLKDL